MKSAPEPPKLQHCPLTTDRFPVREPAVAQLGNVGLELGFRESFAEDLVIATVESKQWFQI